MFPDDTDRLVLHEAFYNALYLMPRGLLKKKLIAFCSKVNVNDTLTAVGRICGNRFLIW
jgi:hypothetical protein|tara:strand:- start:49561 stop:49737 length:177 start_codon:yes stop_codon:yes gene_type:complete